MLSHANDRRLTRARWSMLNAAGYIMSDLSRPYHLTHPVNAAFSIRSHHEHSSSKTSREAQSRLYEALWGDHSQVRRFTLLIQPANATFLNERYGYTYKFKPAPYQDDPVFDCIKEAIAQLNGDPEHGVRMCNHNFWVRASTNAPPIWPPSPSDEDLEVKFYTFFRDEQEFPATAPVSVISREGPLTVDKLHVREGGQ